MSMVRYCYKGKVYDIPFQPTYELAAKRICKKYKLKRLPNGMAYYVKYGYYNVIV